MGVLCPCKLYQGCIKVSYTVFFLDVKGQAQSDHSLSSRDLSSGFELGMCLAGLFTMSILFPCFYFPSVSFRAPAWQVHFLF